MVGTPFCFFIVMEEKFSVLLSVYRKERPEWFRESLESVFGQTVRPAEVVLVADGPLTAELDAVIAEFTRRCGWSACR